MIELINVTKEYHGVRVVDNLTLTINQGEFIVIVGPSGCGKTTTMKMINRLIEPTGGTIRINGQDISRTDPIQLRRGIGYVIQEIGLLPHLTVGANVALVPRLQKWPKAKQMERVAGLLEMVGLPPDIFLHKYPQELSGGQQQRVGVARALALDPPLLLMDEPFGALDPITREQLQNEFLQLQKMVKKTIVFVTHDMDEAIKFANRIVVMNYGKVVQVDTPKNILRDPADSFVMELLGTDNILKQLSLVKVRQAMLTDVAHVFHDDTVAVAENLLHSGYGTLVVLDRDGRVMGYLNRDTLRKVPENQPVAGVMISGITVIGPDNSLKEALTSMIKKDAECAAVVGDEGSLAGVITRSCFQQEIYEPLLDKKDTGGRVVC